MENLLATLEDYAADLRSWVSGSFFFSKIVRLCLDQCAKEYSKRLLLRAHCIPSAQATATLVENDLKVCACVWSEAWRLLTMLLPPAAARAQNLVDFFAKYAADLRRTGIRSVDDIKREFANVQAMRDTLRASAGGNNEQEQVACEDPQQRDVVAHVKKLLRSTSTQEAKVADDKAAKQAAKKKAKLKGFSSKSADKEKKSKPDKKTAAKEAGSDKKEAASRESSFPEAGGGGGSGAVDQDGGFEVQKLNMSDFLGG